MLTRRVAENGSLKREIAELKARLTKNTEDVKQTQSLKRRVSELEATVTQVTESASEKHNALEKEKQELRAQLDRQNGIGIGDLSPDELRALYGQSLSTASKLATTLNEHEARTLLEIKHIGVTPRIQVKQRKLFIAMCYTQKLATQPTN